MKILIVRVGALGDVLHALPAVAALRRERPDWQIDWVVERRWAGVLAAGDGPGSWGPGPVVNHVHLAEAQQWSRAPASPGTLKSILALRRSLRAQRYDLAVDLQGTLRSAVIARMSGAAQIYGYADPREPLAAKLYRKKIAREGVHVVEQGAALLGAATATALTPAAVELPLAAWADEWAAELVGRRRVCFLAPGGGWGAKRWPARHFGELAQRLDALGFTVMVNASRKDDVLAAAAIAASEGKAQIAVCNVTGMVALVRRCALLVGGDSGPGHLAAALGVPLVALFGPTDPARNGPWGLGPIAVLRDPSSLTSYKRSDEPDPGMERISVDAVLAAVQGLMKPWRALI
jgi:heptosyltransferase-1